MATIIGAGLAMADEPMGRSVNNDERALAQQLHHEHSRAQFLQGVMVRDGDHDGIRADRFFLQAAESARLAGDQPLSGALRLAAKHALHHLQRTFAHGMPVEVKRQGFEFLTHHSSLTYTRTNQLESQLPPPCAQLKLV